LGVRGAEPGGFRPGAILEGILRVLARRTGLRLAGSWWIPAEAGSLGLTVRGVTLEWRRSGLPGIIRESLRRRG